MAPLFASISSLGSSGPRPTAPAGPSRRGDPAGGNGRLTSNPPESIHWNFMRRGSFGTQARVCYSRFPHAARRQEYSAESRASVEGRSFPIMEHPTRVGNRLLDALPPADFDLLAPYLRKVSLGRDAVLVRSGDPIEQIYFPESGTIAFIMDMPNGQTVATAVIGNEGAVGLLSALGPSRSPLTAVVRVAGTSLQISPARFHAAFRQSGAIRHAVQIYTKALLAQFQH